MKEVLPVRDTPTSNHLSTPPLANDFDDNLTFGLEGAFIERVCLERGLSDRQQRVWIVADALWIVAHKVFQAVGDVCTRAKELLGVDEAFDAGSNLGRVTLNGRIDLDPVFQVKADNEERVEVITPALVDVAWLVQPLIPFSILSYCSRHPRVSGAPITSPSARAGPRYRANRDRTSTF